MNIFTVIITFSTETFIFNQNQCYSYFQYCYCCCYYQRNSHSNHLNYLNSLQHCHYSQPDHCFLQSYTLCALFAIPLCMLSVFPLILHLQFPGLLFISNNAFHHKMYRLLPIICTTQKHLIDNFQENFFFIILCTNRSSHITMRRTGTHLSPRQDL